MNEQVVYLLGEGAHEDYKPLIVFSTEEAVWAWMDDYWEKLPISKRPRFIARDRYIVSKSKPWVGFDTKASRSDVHAECRRMNQSKPTTWGDYYMALWVLGEYSLDELPLDSPLSR